MSGVGLTYPYVGKWRKEDLLTIQFDEEDGVIYVSLVGELGRAPAEEYTSASVIVNWSCLNRAEWGLEEFELISDNKMISQGTLSWYRITQQLLSIDDVSFFKTHGYLVIKGAVAPLLLFRARRSIFAHIGTHGIPPNELSSYTARTFVPDLLRNKSECEPLMDILEKSPLTAIVSGLIGLSKPLCCPPQVAMRLPSPLVSDLTPAHPCGLHIDGIPTPDNGVAGGDYLHSFSMLVGVALTDQSSPNCGNLTVCPGSHLRCSEVLRAQWREQAARGVPAESRLLGPGHGGGWSIGSFIAPGSTSASSAPVQLLLEAGDAVLLHYQLAHGVSPHRGDTPRVNLYWRAVHQNHRAESLLEPFADFDAIF